ncbi:hypothetical protein [Microbacterium sp. J1-1]|uniref:hypothetical protein n=1 Tax=Microbacterium sp. J1-1 TaxID=2992441 RepID=UPI002113D139|nr:hypothetical protein [Microbacterium sp. J1-1]UUE21436.1 hypothetical protein LRQ07_03960 [Microbacterium sp. J1-1]
MNASRSVTAASIALLALLFTGCAAGASDSGSDAKPESADKPAATQTKEEACDIMVTSLSDLQSLSSVDTSDPNAALAAFKEAQGKVDDAAKQVSNDEVKPSADDSAAALKGYVDFLDQASSDPANVDVSKMSEHVQALTDSITELSTVCS